MSEKAGIGAGAIAEKHNGIKRYPLCYSVCLQRFGYLTRTLFYVELVLYCVFLAWLQWALMFLLGGPRKKNQFTDSGARKYLTTNTPVKDTVELISLIMKVFLYVLHF